MLNMTEPDDNTEIVPVKQDQYVGTVFAERYKILEAAGRGGMSVVYKARHKYIDRNVAIKMMHHHLVDDATSVKRFQHEAKAASSLIHPNIINVFDFGVSREGDAFIVMDYLEGCALSDMIGSGGPIAEFEAIEVIRQTCRGLAHAHKKGVVHRDLKPANLVMSVDEDYSVQVKIVDFGIAKVTSQEGQPSQHLTRTGEVFGSPLYMSPEQWNGEKMDHRSDIYSLGCLIYEMLAGVPPLAGETPLDTMTLHLNEKPLTFKEFDSKLNVSDALESLVLKCLEKRPEKRFNDVLEIIRELPSEIDPAKDQSQTVAVRLSEAIESTSDQQKTTTPKPPPSMKRSKFKFSYRKRAQFFSIAFLLLAGFICLYQGPEEDPGPPASKMIWQLELSASNILMNARMYGVALPILQFASWHADHLDPIFSRPNFEKRFQTLGRLAACYNAANRSSDFENTITAIADLDRMRWETSARKELHKLAAAKAYIKELRKNRQSIQAHLSEPRLNWAASVQALVEIARRLDANFSYELEYQLLFNAEKVLTELYGPNFVGIAQLQLQRAVCLKNQDRIGAIDAKQEGRTTKDGIYGSIKHIWEINAKKSLGVPVTDDLSLEQIAQEPDYMRALLKLGQWQRRMNRHKQAEETLTKALQSAKKYNKFEPDELAEFYTSYANLLYQINRHDEALKYRDLAKKQRQLCAKNMGMNYIEHHVEEGFSD